MKKKSDWTEGRTVIAFLWWCFWVALVLVPFWVLFIKVIGE